MNLTVGFIALVISLIIPGMLYRRFYFFGEFSKQFSINEPILKTFTYSLVTGLIVQLVVLKLYNEFFEAVNIEALIKFHSNLFTNNLAGEKVMGTIFGESGDLNNSFFGTFLYYTFIVYVIAAFSGAGAARLFRKLKLDRFYKILRYRNQWYYMFSAEILQFPKFKKELGVDLKTNEYLFTQVDVLEVQNERSTCLYSGYLVDYDLDQENIMKLDKLYLKNVERYVKLEDNTQTIVRKIPGDLFVIRGQNILNLNLSYVLKKKNERSLKSKYQLICELIMYVILVTFLLSIPVALTPNAFVQGSLLEPYFKDFRVYDRLLILFLFFISTALLPLRYNRRYDYYEWVDLKKHFKITVVYMFFIYIGFALFFYVTGLFDRLAST